MVQAQPSVLAAIARGLSAVLDVVTAALSERWFNGQTEGQINSLKMLKRRSMVLQLSNFFWRASNIRYEGATEIGSDPILRTDLQETAAVVI